jgi:hypothetical protein
MIVSGYAMMVAIATSGKVQSSAGRIRAREIGQESTKPGARLAKKRP